LRRCTSDYAFAKGVQRDLHAMRAWMRERGQAHDLEFQESTADYMRWLDGEIASVRAELDRLSSHI
jgi:hypothetical protein